MALNIPYSISPHAKALCIRSSVMASRRHRYSTFGPWDAAEQTKGTRSSVPNVRAQAVTSTIKQRWRGTTMRHENLKWYKYTQNHFPFMFPNAFPGRGSAARQ